jgi:hypothetical protein
MPCPSNSSWFYHSNNIWWGVQIIQLLIVQYIPLPCYLVPLMTTFLSQHSALIPAEPTFLLQYKRPRFTPIPNYRQNYSSVYFNLYITGKQTGRQTIEDHIVADVPWLQFALKFSMNAVLSFERCSRLCEHCRSFKAFITCFYVVFFPSMLFSRYVHIKLLYVPFKAATEIRRNCTNSQQRQQDVIIRILQLILVLWRLKLRYGVCKDTVGIMQRARFASIKKAGQLTLTSADNTCCVDPERIHKECRVSYCYTSGGTYSYHWAWNGFSRCMYHIMPRGIR